MRAPHPTPWPSGGERTGRWLRDLSALPGVVSVTADDAASAAVTVEVDGETCALDPDEFDGTNFDWLSGPDAGYGFAVSPTRDWSLEEHRECIRTFLAQINPATGFIEDG